MIVASQGCALLHLQHLAFHCCESFEEGASQFDGCQAPGSRRRWSIRCHRGGLVFSPCSLSPPPARVLYRLGCSTRTALREPLLMSGLRRFSCSHQPASYSALSRHCAGRDSFGILRLQLRLMPCHQSASSHVGVADHHHDCLGRYSRVREGSPFLQRASRSEHPSAF